MSEKRPSRDVFRLARFAEICNRHGVDSDEAADYRARFLHRPRLVELMDVAMMLKQALMARRKG